MSVASLHGELTKQQRQTTLAAFRRGEAACRPRSLAAPRSRLPVSRGCVHGWQEKRAGLGQPGHVLGKLRAPAPTPPPSTHTHTNTAPSPTSNPPHPPWDGAHATLNAAS